MRDRFDLSVTAASAQAVADYVAAVDLLLSANVGADVLLERAMTADPDFALAHIARPAAAIAGANSGPQSIGSRCAH